MANMNYLSEPHDPFTDIFTEAQWQETWSEGIDDVGPRYFFGYIHHLHDKRGCSGVGCRHTMNSGTTLEDSFLHACSVVAKGMIFTGGWNEYAEGIVMEPSNNTVARFVVDSHTAWVSNRPVFLDNLKARMKPVVQPPQVMNRYSALWPFNNSEWDCSCPYPLDDCLSTLGNLDFSGNGHALTLVNAGYSLGDRHEGSHALDLETAGAYADAASSIDLGDKFSIVAWVKTSSQGNIQTIMANTGGGCGANGFRLYVNAYNESGQSDQRILFETGNGSTCALAATSTGVFAWNQWNMVAVTVDRTVGTDPVRIYYNGEPITSGPIVTDFCNTGAVRLGAMTVAAYFNLRGKLDNVRIYKGVLTDEEIRNLYVSDSCPMCP
jgi:hypothetical protein